MEHYQYNKNVDSKRTYIIEKDRILRVKVRESDSESYATFKWESGYNLLQR